MNNTGSTILLLLGLAVAVPFCAVDAASNSSAELFPGMDEILVVGARLSRPLQDVVGSVDVIEREQLLQTLSFRMSDLVRYTPGISVGVTDTRFGESEFTIRGLTGSRVLTLIDGIPQPDQFNVGSFSHAGQNYFSPDAISRIEILKGPASTLFGSDALGGVIAVITREPDELLKGNNAGAEFSSIYSGADDSLMLNASVAAKKGRTSALALLSRMDGTSIYHNKTDASDLQEKTRDSGLIKINHTLSSGNQLRFRADFLDETVQTNIHSLLGYGRQYRKTTGLAGDDSLKKVNLSFGYDFEPGTNWLQRGVANLYTQHTDIIQLTTEMRGPEQQIRRHFDYGFNNSGLTVDLESTWHTASTSHRIGWGIRLQSAEISETRNGDSTNMVTGQVTNVLLGETFPVRDFPNSRVDEFAAYVHDEIEIGQVTLIPAVRFERYSLDAEADALYREDNPHTEVHDITATSMTPKFGLNWKYSDDLNLYAQYARGFRAPPFQDVNIGLDIALFNYRAIPNPDLESETSDGIELGFRFRGDTVYASGALYAANYQNFIETKVNVGRDPETNAVLFQSINIDEARIYGIEGKLKAILDDWTPGLSVEVAANITHGENLTNRQPLNTVDPAELVAGMTWDKNEKMRFAFIVTAVEKNKRVDQTAEEVFVPGGFLVADLTARFKPWQRVSIDVGIFNLFDETYWRWSSVRNRAIDDPVIPLLSAPGRYGSVSLRVTL